MFHGLWPNRSLFAALHRSPYEFKILEWDKKSKQTKKAKLVLLESGKVFIHTLEKTLKKIKNHLYLLGLSLKIIQFRFRSKEYILSFKA